MDDESNDDLPPFPSSPNGIGRMEHLPTVEAGIRYWEAVRVRATEADDLALELTAFGLRSSYEQAHHELTNAGSAQKKPAPRRARRGQLEAETAHDDTSKI